jgi:hypothetical protein
MSPETYRWAVVAFVAGMVTAWLLLRPGRCRHLKTGPALGETLDESLARLAKGHRPGVRMGSGQVVMGPNQPRPAVQDHIPHAPPRGGYRSTGGVVPVDRMPRAPGSRPAGMPTTGTTGGAGQARAT